MVSEKLGEVEQELIKAVELVNTSKAYTASIQKGIELDIERFKQEYTSKFKRILTCEVELNQLKLKVNGYTCGFYVFQQKTNVLCVATTCIFEN